MKKKTVVRPSWAPAPSRILRSWSYRRYGMNWTAYRTYETERTGRGHTVILMVLIVAAFILIN